MMSLEDRLPGTYRLVAMETRTTDRQVSWPMGERPTGIFMFDGSNFCVQISPTDHGEGDSGVVAMFGTYEVDEFAWVFVLTPEVAVDPSLVGRRIVRQVALDGDLAIFTTPPTVVDGAEATTMITWRRVSGCGDQRSLSGRRPPGANQAAPYRLRSGDRGRVAGRRQRGLLGQHGRVCTDGFSVTQTVRCLRGARIAVDDTEPERHEVHARRQAPGDAQRGRRCGGSRSAIR